MRGGDLPGREMMMSAHRATRVGARKRRKRAGSKSAQKSGSKMPRSPLSASGVRVSAERPETVSPKRKNGFQFFLRGLWVPLWGEPGEGHGD